MVNAIHMLSGLRTTYRQHSDEKSFELGFVTAAADALHCLS